MMFTWFRESHDARETTIAGIKHELDRPSITK